MIRLSLHLKHLKSNINPEKIIITHQNQRYVLRLIYTQLNSPSCLTKALYILVKAPHIAGQLGLCE